MAGTTKNERLTTHPGSDLRQLAIQFNNLLKDLELVRLTQQYDSLNWVGAAAGSAIATTTTKAKSVNTVTYAVNGAIKSKAGTDNLWDPTNAAQGSAGTVVAASSWQKYLLCLDASGTASVYEGTQSTVSAAAVSFTTKQLPPSTVTVIAVATVATDGSHTFTPGTTAFNGTGITTTFSDGTDPAVFVSQGAANPVASGTALTLLGALIANAAGTVLTSTQY